MAPPTALALEQRQDEGEGEVAEHQQDGADEQHRGGLALMVDVVAEDGGDGHGQQREHREDGLGGAALEAHHAVDHEGHDGGGHQAVFQALAVLDEVAGEGACGNHQHDDVLHDGDGLTGPERPGGGLRQGKVALEHIHGIFLEREDRRIVEHAEEGDKPETKAGKDLADVLDLERIVLLLGLAGLAVEFLVHEEIGDEHDQGDAEQHHAEGDGTADVDLAAELGEEGREDHAGGHAQTGEGHLGAHGQGRLTALEPLDDAAAHRNAGHLAAAAEDHEAAGGQLGGGGHALVEREDVVDEADPGVPVEVVGEPVLEAGAHEGLADGVVLDQAAHQHDRAGEHGREADAHLVQDDAGEDQEEHEYVEERLGALHRAEGLGIPSARGLHQVLDRGEDVHEDVGAEHREGQQQQGDPAHRRRIPQRLLGGSTHIS